MTPLPVRFGLAVLLALLAIAVAAPWLTPYDPAAIVGPPFEPPSARHWLGTNDIGHDLLAELVHATRVSLTIGILVGLLATALGTIVGTTAGYAGGTVDSMLMRAVDLVLVMPFLPLMILLAAFLGSSQWQLIAVLGLLLWARPSRVIRAQALAVASRDYVRAARALGASHLRVLMHHLVPAVLPLAATQFVLVAGSAIALEASLSFLGLGDPTRKSWGAMLFYAQARHALLTGQWLWWVVPPGLLIGATVVSLALIGLARDVRRA